MPPITLDGSLGITTPMYNGSITANAVTPVNSFKNRIINGNFVIDQRNAGASVTPTNGQYLTDRWAAALTQASKFTAQQNAGSVTPPAGFINYLGCTSSSAYSVLTGDLFIIQQLIEGLNIADFGWGTANAQTVTLSFWVRSSLTGTHSGALANSAGNRSYPFSFTVSSANTWEQKSITIAGDTTGTWLTTNGIGIGLRVNLGSGSTFTSTANSWQAGNFTGVTGAVSVVGTNGATFYITGVQLEVGSTATSFDYRPYTTELQLCQRYLPAFKAIAASGILGVGQAYSTTDAILTIPFPVTARTSPSGIIVSAANHFNCWLSNTGLANPTAINFNQSTPFSGTITATGGASLVAGNSTSVFFSNASGNLYFTGCEL